MAFFDELGKKISQAGQSAVQKGKEIADIARINSSISDEERKIDDSYREIGKLYFSLHGENPDVDFAALVAGIQESGNKITEYRQQIKDIKGVVCCEKCGAEVSSNAAFCSSCGAPMPVKACGNPAGGECSSGTARGGDRVSGAGGTAGEYPAGTARGGERFCRAGGTAGEYPAGTA